MLCVNTPVKHKLAMNFCSLLPLKAICQVTPEACGWACGWGDVPKCHEDESHGKSSHVSLCVRASQGRAAVSPRWPWEQDQVKTSFWHTRTCWGHRLTASEVWRWAGMERNSSCSFLAAHGCCSHGPCLGDLLTLCVASSSPARLG